jgi:hypothetical protein
MENITRFIETRLKLLINQRKSNVALSKDMVFLGITIVQGTIAIAARSLNRAMQKVKELTPCGTFQPLEETIKSINQWYVGWSGYFSMTQYPAQLERIEVHVRRRLRSRLVDQQKRRRYLFKKLVKRGHRRWVAKTVFSKKGRWALSHTPAVERSYPNRWFIEEMKLKVRSDENLGHWFD